MPKNHTPIFSFCNSGYARVFATVQPFSRLQVIRRLYKDKDRNSTDMVPTFREFVRYLVSLEKLLPRENPVGFL